MLVIREVIERTDSKLAVFNGRAGLERIDNLHAGCAGTCAVKVPIGRYGRFTPVAESLAADVAWMASVVADRKPCAVEANGL